MRLSIWPVVLMAGSCLAQGDLAALLSSQPDLSTLLELVGLVPGLAEKLAAASNITIAAPTNQAFAAVPRDTPEGEAVEYRNDTIAIGALLANHVFKGAYPSNVITDIPTFAQTLLDNTYINVRQPFTNITGGAYNELVRNGKDVCIISGEQTISTITQADIKLGEGITIHKIDTVLSFAPPLQLSTYRSGYTDMNAAVGAANLGIDFGLTGPDDKGLNISDYTIFIPTNEAFESIGSVLASADLKTLQAVLSYHIIPNKVIFSTFLGNITVPSLQGANLTFTVLPDGSAWVNDAKITFANTILFNGVAHVIDNVLSPGIFDRSSLQAAKPASQRVAYANASSVSAALPFTSLAFAGDQMTYSFTPTLLQTVAAVATPTVTVTITSSSSLGSTFASQSTPASYTGVNAGGRVFAHVGVVVAVVVGVSAYLLGN